MAKMFYTLEEAKASLGRSEDEIKQFAREGRLREFRDGPRLMFKADQVEQLRAELGAGGDTVDLGVSDSGGMIGLVDTTGASGTSITLAEADTGMGGDSPSGTGTGMRLKDDTVYFVARAAGEGRRALDAPEPVAVTPRAPLGVQRRASRGLLLAVDAVPDGARRLGRRGRGQRATGGDSRTPNEGQ